MIKRIPTLFFIIAFCFSNEVDSMFRCLKKHTFPQNVPLHREARQVQGECSSNITVGLLGGNITSPGYPNQYDSNMDCRWLLQAPDDDSKIVLKIISLELESARNCDLDYLQVYAGLSSLSPLSGHLCGTIRNRVIQTNSSKVLIVFHSDPSYEDKGFLLEYYTESLSGCQNTLTEASGTITSPGFPAEYPDSSDCWTLISVAEEKKILLQFDIIDLEYDENCTYDYVEVFDGATKDAANFGRYCTNTQKGQMITVESTSNILLVHFFSDHLIHKKGFRIHYSSITPDTDISELGGCLWESEVDNGTIASPNYPQKYPSSSECKILLTAPPGEIITIVFDSLNLEIDGNCSYDYVEVVDVVSDEILGKFCGKQTEVKELKSKQNILKIIFYSDDFAEFSGFKAKYWFSTLNKDKNEEPTTTTKSPIDENIFLAVPENATLPLGASYMLPCVFNNPAAKIRWLKDEQFMGGTNPLPGLKLVANNTLWIQSMTRQLSGVYQCTAITTENVQTATVTAWVLMENNQSQDDDTDCNIVFRKKPKDSVSMEGDFAFMECIAAGAQIELTWEKNGMPVVLKRHSLEMRNSFLFIDNATVEDSGTYTCIVFDHATKCEKRANAFLTVNKKAKISEICGRPKLGQPSKDKPRLDHEKIIGGQNAKKGAYPWQVMLWDKRLKAFCGGTILNERWIITAAHCFVSYKNLKIADVEIKMGKFARDEREPLHEFTTHIEDHASIIIHPSYSNRTFDNDIALVRLREHIGFTDYILPICLENEDLDNNIFSNSGLRMGTVTGWGKLKEGGGTPKYLQEIKMPIVDRKTCIASTTFTVTRNMFCAGYAQEIVGDSCHGDSGGPFIISHENKWYLVGIVSWGEGCGEPGKYGFYTKVNNYLPWIKGIIKS